MMIVLTVNDLNKLNKTNKIAITGAIVLITTLFIGQQTVTAVNDDNLFELEILSNLLLRQIEMIWVLCNNHVFKYSKFDIVPRNQQNVSISVIPVPSLYH